ncbi:MAG: ABC transporter ATP-binding protein, partial [Ramlibacter sp.]|nr:ABC transporter ATP-binding protein [Ramlibacter sp.]
VLLLDEPFASLNAMLRQSLRDELAEVRRKWGIPALMITHDIDDVLELADVAFIYKDGQVVQEINLRDATSRALAVAQFAGASQIDEAPRRKKLRAMLKGAHN